MQLTFTKRTGKYDDLVIARPGQPVATFTCPKQGIIPHDMVHFAVEATLAHGFLTLVAEGHPATADTVGSDGEEAVERLVEVFQAELWGGRVPAADLIATYEHACAARHHAAPPVSRAVIDAIHTRLDMLTRRWAGVPVNGSLTLKFARAA